jgi:DNA-binding Lrp family transcriptional regulator
MRRGETPRNGLGLTFPGRENLDLFSIGGDSMIISAYVFIECTAGASTKVVKEVVRIPGVKRANATTGPYDVIVLVEAPDITILGEFIVTKIQSLSGVLRTQTNVIVD